VETYYFVDYERKVITVADIPDGKKEEYLSEETYGEEAYNSLEEAKNGAKNTLERESEIRCTVIRKECEREIQDFRDNHTVQDARIITRNQSTIGVWQYEGRPEDDISIVTSWKSEQHGKYNKCFSIRDGKWPNDIAPISWMYLPDTEE
jgi:hypothetical protein